MKTYNFPDMVRGDDFHERSIKFTINDVDIDWANADNKAIIQFRLSNKHGRIFKEITLTDGLTANDPATGWIKIEEFSTDTWPSGRYYYDIELDIDGKISTYLGGIIELLQDVTRKTT